jgi:hypothetical protein
MTSQGARRALAEPTASVVIPVFQEHEWVRGGWGIGAAQRIMHLKEQGILSGPNYAPLRGVLRLSLNNDVQGSQARVVEAIQESAWP